MSASAQHELRFDILIGFFAFFFTLFDILKAPASPSQSRWITPAVSDAAGKGMALLSVLVCSRTVCCVRLMSMVIIVIQLSVFVLVGS